MERLDYWEREQIIRGYMREDPFKLAMMESESEEGDPFHNEIVEARRRCRENGQAW